ncbi:MAG: PDZ domain-containing protein [Gemmatimonadetes bacterium]|nr:PDZ domain-containing protein [Gemmatimonadota bacterium]
MSPSVEDQDGLGASFPGPIARWLLALVLPSDCRDAFEGDLIEEAETVVLPQRGRRVALRWFWWQIATSAPPMLARHLYKEVGMYPKRWIVPAALLFIWGIWGLADLGNTPDGGFAWGNSEVISVDPGGPADLAGLKAGDRILTMDGIPPTDLDALRHQPRTEIGQTRVIMVERADEASGSTTTEKVEITYARPPAGVGASDLVGGIIGLVFLLTGLFVFLKIPGKPSLLFAIVGFGFAAMLLPSPYIHPYGVRTLAANLFFLAFLTGFASLLHLLLVYPVRKRILEGKYMRWLIYLPVVAFALLGLINALVKGGLGAPGALILGIVLIGYAVMALAALIHSFVTAAPKERSEMGLNLMLAGVLVGLIPITLMMVAGMFVRTDLIPGGRFLILSLVLIPISFGVALLKGARASLDPEAPQPA